MFLAMPFDLARLPAVACIAFGVGLGCHALQPPAPPPEPGPIASPKKPSPVPAGCGRHLVVGVMCPQGAGGRPAVAGIALRGVQWTADVNDIGAALERGSVPRFVVFGVDGKMAGTFDTLGVVEIGIPVPVASGAYAGASPCTYATPGGDPGARSEDPRCGQFVQSCGLAAGELAAPGEPPATIAFHTGGACVAGDQLSIDVDGSGQLESFPLAGVLDGISSPANEWTASPTSGAPCKPQFQIYDIKVVPDLHGKAPDPKATVMVDVLGVVDLDNDGRKEIVLALRFQTVRTIVVYSPTEISRRLDLVGEATSFPR